MWVKHWDKQFNQIQKSFPSENFIQTTSLLEPNIFFVFFGNQIVLESEGWRNRERKKKKYKLNSCSMLTQGVASWVLGWYLLTRPLTTDRGDDLEMPRSLQRLSSKWKGEGGCPFINCLLSLNPIVPSYSKERKKKTSTEILNLQPLIGDNMGCYGPVQ